MQSINSSFNSGTHSTNTSTTSVAAADSSPAAAAAAGGGSVSDGQVVARSAVIRKPQSTACLVTNKCNTSGSRTGRDYFDTSSELVMCSRSQPIDSQLRRKIQQEVNGRQLSTTNTCGATAGSDIVFNGLLKGPSLSQESDYVHFVRSETGDGTTVDDHVYEQPGIDDPLYETPVDVDKLEAEKMESVTGHDARTCNKQQQQLHSESFVLIESLTSEKNELAARVETLLKERQELTLKCVRFIEINGQLHDELETCRALINQLQDKVKTCTTQTVNVGQGERTVGLSRVEQMVEEFPLKTITSSDLQQYHNKTELDNDNRLNSGSGEMSSGVRDELRQAIRLALGQQQELIELRRIIQTQNEYIEKLCQRDSVLGLAIRQPTTGNTASAIIPPSSAVPVELDDSFQELTPNIRPIIDQRPIMDQRPVTDQRAGVGCVAGNQTTGSRGQDTTRYSQTARLTDVSRYPLQDLYDTQSGLTLFPDDSGRYPDRLFPAHSSRYLGQETRWRDSGNVIDALNFPVAAVETRVEMAGSGMAGSGMTGSGRVRAAGTKVETVNGARTSSTAPAVRPVTAAMHPSGPVGRPSQPGTAAALPRHTNPFATAPILQTAGSSAVSPASRSQELPQTMRDLDEIPAGFEMMTACPICNLPIPFDASSSAAFSRHVDECISRVTRDGPSQDSRPDTLRPGTSASRTGTSASRTGSSSTPPPQRSSSSTPRPEPPVTNDDRNCPVCGNAFPASRYSQLEFERHVDDHFTLNEPIANQFVAL